MVYSYYAKMYNVMSKKQKAFTIVELLVIIAIIGILAAITIVSYRNITNKAIAAGIKSDLDSNSKLLRMYNVEHGAYPSSFGTDLCPLTPEIDNNYCLKATKGNKFSYVGGSQSFILTNTNITSGITYEINDDGDMTEVVQTEANGYATSDDILSGKKAYVNGGLVTGTIASKAAATYTPTVSDQTISAGQFLSGAQLIKGDVDLAANNILSGVNIFSVDGSIAKKTAATYTPTTSDQTIASGQYLSGAQTVKGDADLTAGNILSGVNIFGVTGSASPSSLITHSETGSYTPVNTSGRIYVWTITFTNAPVFIYATSTSSMAQSFYYDFVNSTKHFQYSTSAGGYDATGAMTVSYNSSTKTVTITVDFNAWSGAGKAVSWYAIEQ